MRRYRDGADALKAMCFGFEPKEIAFFLMEDGIWADKDLDIAVTRVNACLNPKKQEFFHFSEIIAISKRTRNFDAVFYACDEMGLTRPMPVSIEEQMFRVECVMNDAAALMKNAVDEMNHIKTQLVPVELGDKKLGQVLHFSQPPKFTFLPDKQPDKD